MTAIETCAMVVVLAVFIGGLILWGLALDRADLSD